LIFNLNFEFLVFLIEKMSKYLFLMKNGRKRRGLVRKEHLLILLFPDELAAIDDFRFTHRMPSRAAAVRELLRQGIGACGAS
jgi:hypothetical protein